MSTIIKKTNSSKSARIEYKINELIEWSRKYPRVEIAKASTIKYLIEYAASDEEYQSLKARHQKMREYYDYIKNSKYDRKLSKDMFEKARNGNVRGIFGYSDDILILAKKYRINAFKINYLVSKYGSMEEFLKVNRAGQIDEEDMLVLKDNLTDVIDINNKKNKQFNILYRYIGQRDNVDLLDRSIQLVDYNELKEYIYKMLTPKESKVIITRYGLESGESKTLREIAEEWQCTYQGILALEVRAIEKLRQANVLKKITKFGRYCLDEERRNIIENRIYNSNAIFIPDEEYNDEPCDISTLEYRKILGKSSYIKYESLSAIELSPRSYNCLMRAGIDTIQKLLEVSEYTLQNIKNLGTKGLEEVLTKRNEVRNQYQFQPQKRAQTPLDTIELLEKPGVLYNVLMRSGIDTVEKLMEADETTLRKYKNIGEKRISEILEIKAKLIEARSNSYNQNEDTIEDEQINQHDEKTELETLDEENERLLKQLHGLEAQKIAAKKLSEPIEK